MKNSQLDGDMAKLDKERARSESYSLMIIKEQEGILEATDEGIRRVNDELKALRTRLAPYVSENPATMDEKGVDLKHRYSMKLRERDTFEKARSMAEESITAAKIHMIPGELDRIPRAPNEKGYHGLGV